MQEHLRITDPKTARVLTDIKTVRLLRPFMKRPLSLGDAARELGVKLPMLTYHVNRFLDMGILEVACTERRHGRSINLYSSTAESFFIPFHLTPSESLEHLVTSLTAPEAGRFRRELARTLQRIAPDWGLQVARTERQDRQDVAFSITQSGNIANRSLEDTLLEPGRPALFSTEGRIFFDFHTAKAFQRDLKELADRYADKQIEQGQAYAFRLGLTPMQDESLE